MVAAAPLDLLAAHQLRVEQALGEALNAAAYMQRDEKIDRVTVIAAHLLQHALSDGSLVGDQVVDGLHAEISELRDELARLRAGDSSSDVSPIDMLAAHTTHVETALGDALSVVAYMQQDECIDPITVIIAHLLSCKLSDGSSLVGDQLVDGLRAEITRLRDEVVHLRADGDISTAPSAKPDAVVEKKQEEEEGAHGQALVLKLEDDNEDVRQAVVETLGKLEPAALSEHAPALVTELKNDDGYVRQAAVEFLGKLEPGALSEHASAVAAKLEDEDVYVRGAAMEALSKLEPAALLEHATAVVSKLEDSDGDVRYLAVEALGKLEPTALLKYVPAIAAKLEDSYGDVRYVAVETLGKLEPTVLSQYAHALATKLEDSDEGVREAALEALGKLEPAALQALGEHVVQSVRG